MMLLADRGLAILLIVGAALHTMGTLTSYAALSEIWVWSLGAALAAALIGAINLLRSFRRADRVLAVICGVSALLWAAVALEFGAAIGNIGDPRVLLHTITALGLAAFALRQAMA